MELKDLKDRKYSGNDCVGFTYDIISEDDNIALTFEFCRNINDDQLRRRWHVFTRFFKTGVADTQCYYIEFELPKDNLPLTLICATGLKYFQLYLKDEILQKQTVDFIIGDLTRDM